ncbi:hypothetical protein ACFONC_01170 [Luteimonas soli]|uniref:DUF4436 domain-containing protein n=1 Tax=Luteimonas soli TaxID=1648966 RepID=A0ABV7XG97_9GAMM
MKKILWALLPWLAILSMVAHGHEVEVLETYPPGDRVELGPGQEFHLRIAYSTDPVARIFVRPYLDGREIFSDGSPSPAYRGEGETSAWFSFKGIGDSADEVRVFIGNSSGLKKPALVYPVSIASVPAADAPPPAPAWVATLKDGVVAATGGPQQPMTQGDKIGMSVFMVVVFGLALFGLVAPAWCFRRWHGGWRIAAAIPMVGMGLFVVFLLLTAVFDPGSLGLLPFVVLMGAVPCSVAIIVLFLVRKFTGADRRETA